MKIHGESIPDLEGIESLHLSGITGDTVCPLCHAHTLVDFEASSILYPENGCENEIGVCCEQCEHQWKERFILRVIAQAIPISSNNGEAGRWDEEPKPIKEKKEAKKPRNNNWLSLFRK